MSNSLVVPKKKFNLTAYIIWGLVLGLLTGLMFGDLCAHLKIIGVIFIQLLQMTILPYILTSLIVGIGGLSFYEARNLAIRGGVLLFLFWGAILAVVFMMPLAFPTVETASFFSVSSVAEPPHNDFLALYIPSNPFSSLANSMVPAVVLFGICIGIALISIKEKKEFINVMTVARDALTKVAKAVVYLTPIGVFAFAANAAGTMTIEDVARLQVFFITFIIMSVVLTFLVFPLIVTTLTPIKYRDVLSISKSALVTSFTTGNLFIILPLITDQVKLLLRSQPNSDNDNQNLPEVIIPVTFNFPDAGQLGSVLFILFGGWFAGSSISVLQYPELAFSGILSFFGGSNLAIPYLLNYYHLSMDYFQLYIIAGIINGYFATMAAAMHLICFTIVCAYSMSHGLKFSIHKIIINTLIAFGITLGLVIVTRFYLSATVETKMTQCSVLDSMSIKNPVKSTVKLEPPKRSLLDEIFVKKNAPNRLEQIRKTKLLRVGYNANTMPFAFFNSKNELVGYDVQMAHNLARDLGCDIEFIPFSFKDIAKGLNNNLIDIVMSGVYVNLDRIKDLDFTEFYMKIHPALMVKDYRAKEFNSLEKIKKMKNLKLAILEGSAFIPAIKKGMPSAKIIEIKSYTDFFEGKVKADALVHSAEQGATWALKYPDYDVVILKGVKHNTAVSYAIAKGDLPFLEYLNYWVKIQKWNGVMDANYSYWVLGNVPELKKPRWSIYHDVLKLDE